VNVHCLWNRDFHDDVFRAVVGRDLLFFPRKLVLRVGLSIDVLGYGL
jgi:hypothetical protein